MNAKEILVRVLRATSKVFLRNRKDDVPVVRTRNKPLTLGLALLAGVSAAAAAEEGTKRLDERIIVGGATHAGTPEAHEPVAYLGVAVTPAGSALAAQLRLPKGQGLVVTLIEPDGPAANAGLQEHDVLTRFDDQILIEPRQLSVLVRSRAEGDKVTLTYVRAGAEAKAAVTLGKHVPPARQRFEWLGEHGPDMLFRTEEFSLPLTPPFEGGLDGAGPHLQPPPPLPGGRRLRVPAERVMIFRPHANVVLSDDAGSLAVRVDEHGRVLTARNPAGEVVFEGPINTAEERAALPEVVRAQLEKLEARDMIDLTDRDDVDVRHVLPPRPAAGVM